MLNSSFVSLFNCLVLNNCSLKTKHCTDVHLLNSFVSLFIKHHLKHAFFFKVKIKTNPNNLFSINPSITQVIYYLLCKSVNTNTEIGVIPQIRMWVNMVFRIDFPNAHAREMSKIGSVRPSPRREAVREAQTWGPKHTRRYKHKTIKNPNGPVKIKIVMTLTPEFKQI